MRRLLVSLAMVSVLFLTVNVVLAANWQTVKTFNGVGDQTTEYFKIDATEWRIKWSYTPKAGIAGDLAAFSMFIYPKGETNLYVDMLLKTGRNETSGTLNVHEGQKEYYLKIGAANVDSWTVTVEQDADTIPSGSSGSSAALAAAIIIVIVAAVAVYIVRKRKAKKSPSTP